MREMGYPPGYLDLEDDNHPSGIIIYANGDTKEENNECINTISEDPKMKMIVDFLGINAPIPVNADQNCWANPNLKPVSFNSYSSNNRPIINRIHSFPGGHSHNPSESSPFKFDYAPNYHNYTPGFPLLSNYANNYLHHINQSTPHYSSYYAYQNTWSSFNG
ncbi:hypothetical protein L1987_61722 [Smallanthus sonchifolius]|uniref:Uncharacterized protein n=1 Tax=Smallanthus sonchifolius TaxID=185202 RepID=A0ACB9C8G0_9ASTR|nr:hypothetical protein L1987_61722 [Smallanthus sonchifolius]